MNVSSWSRLLLAFALAGASSLVAAANHTVVVGHHGFMPRTLVIKAGDSVTWQWAGAPDVAHNVAADGLFRCANGCDGEGGDGTPSAKPWTFTRTFSTPGIVDYYCENHREVGVVGTIVVQDASGNPPPPTVRAVEYYYADWNYYFMTSFADEVAALDGGAYGGVWKRTGKTFQVWDSPVSAVAAATCRFFSTAFAPKSSHFYTPFAGECAAVKTNPDWQFESVAFYMALADGNGECGAGTTPLYRLYNNGMGGAPNHRYTTSLEVFGQMQAAGWVFEGDGRTKIFGCVPVAQGTEANPRGVWKGRSTAGDDVVVVILEDGRLYLMYPDGVVIGSSAGGGNGLVVSGAINYPYDDAARKGDVAVIASLAAPGTLQLTATGKLSLAVSLTFVGGSDQPPAPADLSGEFTGITGHIGGNRAATVRLDANGTFTGTNTADCSLAGAFTPRPSVRAYNWTVLALNSNCIFGMGPLSGLLYYDPARREIRAIAPYGTDAYYLIASKI